eukprot:UN2243
MHRQGNTSQIQAMHHTCKPMSPACKQASELPRATRKTLDVHSAGRSGHEDPASALDLPGGNRPQALGGIETLNWKSSGLCTGFPMTTTSPCRSVSRPTRRPLTKVPLSDSQSCRMTASSALTITACLLETMLGTF